MYTHVCVVLGMLGTIGSSLAASFDCNKAGSHVEKMICADRELSAREGGNPAIQTAREADNISVLSRFAGMTLFGALGFDLT